MMAQQLRICVFGGHGLLGRALGRRAAVSGVPCRSLGRASADLGQLPELRAVLARSDVNLVINAAAYTDVDGAELDAATAFAVNRDGAANLAVACAEIGLPLLHLSTDYVFGETPGRPCREADGTDPLGIYGASKLAGEIAVRRAHPDATIIRTAWLYDPAAAGFVRTVLRLAMQRDALSVVTDQRGSPTHVDDLADGLLAFARRRIRAGTPQAGLYHLSGSSGVSRQQWIAALLGELAACTGRRVSLEAAPAKVIPRPARRPADSTLDCQLIQRDHGIRLPGFAERIGSTVRGCLATLPMLA
ncbi:MAG: dTDP-4-dehydrorhamnose reductase [Pseudomonadales bacterium]|jgi:dTDP-4-dehydrorhamnose reductase|nr:dTDP-4-dehydrorhamnose reductase [Pseudomonadales bacterium]